MAAATELSDLSGIKSFNADGDRNSVGIRWTKWLRSFELFAEGRGVTNAQQKKALLLHCAGESVQDLFFTLTVPEANEGENVYIITKNLLNEQFGQQINEAYERSLFRAMGQEESETIDQYVVRLRERGKLCKFHDLEEMIRDQVIEKCSSARLRRKLLEQKDLKLDKLQEIARAQEVANNQAESMEKLSSSVNRVRVQPVKADKRGFSKSRNRDSQQKNVKCFACGYEGHVKKDENCPAKGKKCRKCGLMNHFAQCCKTKESRKFAKKTKTKIRSVQEGNGSDSEDTNVLEEDYAFSVQNVNRKTVQTCVTVGGSKLKCIIDSGASVNVISQRTWEQLKANKIKCTSKLTDKKLYGYGNPKPLTVIGCFEALVSFDQNKQCQAEFVVIKEEGEALLGKDTATELGLLKITSDVNMVESVINGTNIMNRFPECFKGVGKLKGIQLKVPIDKTVEPVVQPLRRVPYHLREKLEGKLKELEDMDIIEKVEGPSNWVSPVVVVPKSSGDIRLCIDMRAANEAVKRERYAIPTVEEVLQDLNNGKVFSKLDIKWAYHQIELEPESREITTFMTHHGLYRYKRLMFGISCAPEMYNKIIHQALEGCPGVHSIFDDIIVHAASIEEHDSRLNTVLKRLSEKGLTLNPDKCKIGLKQIEFMGHILSEKGVHLADSKARDVKNARRPENATEVRSFLGLVNFSARFIPSLATISEPLRRLTKKSVTFMWGPEQESAFNKLKTALSEPPTLGYYDVNASTQVIADASPVGLGGVLVQKKGEGYRVIMYASRSLTEVERRYSQTEKEALGLVWACERFQMYLQGCTFELVTDHKALEFIFSKRSKPCARIERWVLRLQSFKYKVRHIAGKTNIADALSRLIQKDNNDKEENETEQYLRQVCVEATPKAMSTKEIERESEKDDELSMIRQCLHTGRWDKCSFTQYMPVRHELSSLGKLVLRGTRLVIPKTAREEVLKLAHEGHPGIVVMKQRLRSKVWWPGIDKQTEEFCKTCYGCQLVAKPMNPEPLIRTELPSGPWQSISADFMGPLPSGDYLFVVVDYYSRWVEVKITKTVTAQKTVEMLYEMFSTHGVPISICTDNGPQFISDIFTQFMDEMGVEHRRVTPLYPQANGEVERQNRSLLKRIKIAQAEKKNWKQELLTYLLMYRSTPHSVTGVSPGEALFKRKMKSKLPDLCEYKESDTEMRDKDSERKQKGKEYSDGKRKSKENNLKQGDLVLVKQNRENKLSTNFHPKPMTVVEKNKNSVTVESDQKVQYKRNVTLLKPFMERKNGMEETGPDKSMGEPTPNSPGPIPTTPGKSSPKVAPGSPTSTVKEPDRPSCVVKTMTRSGRSVIKPKRLDL